MRQVPKCLVVVTILRALAAICVPGVDVAFTSLALAGPPLVTDDSETPGRRGWEINISHSLEKTKDQFLMFNPLIDINYGLLENDQWKIEFPILFVDPLDAGDRWGAGDIEVGWKYRWWDEEDRGLTASIYPQALIPTADQGGVIPGSPEDIALGDGLFELFLPVEIGKHFLDDRLFVYAEAGYNVVIDGAGANEWFFGMAMEWAQTDQLELLIELGGVAFEHRGEPDHVFFNAGLKYELNDRWSMIASAGRGIRDRQSGAPELLTFVGLQYSMRGTEDGY